MIYDLVRLATGLATTPPLPIDAPYALQCSVRDRDAALHRERIAGAAGLATGLALVVTAAVWRHAKR